MITKERLTNLIEQGATIYHLIAKNYEEISTNDIPQYKLYNWELYKEYYFEAKERDMEEFGFYSKYHKYTTLKVIGDKYLAVEDNWERYYTDELTKENYIKACELCLRLFRNEE